MSTACGFSCSISAPSVPLRLDTRPGSLWGTPHFRLLQKGGTCSLVEGAGPRDSCRSRKPPWWEQGWGMTPGEGSVASICNPPSIPDSSVASGRRESAPHAEGTREGASFLWDCTWTCGFRCKQTARSGGRGAPQSPPTHRGPRQAVYPTPATQTHRCVVGRTVGRERNSRHRSHGTSLKHNVAHFYFVSEKNNKIIFPSEGKAVREGLCPGSSEPPRLTPAGRPWPPRLQPPSSKGTRGRSGQWGRLRPG